MITKDDIRKLTGGKTPKLNLDRLVIDLNDTMQKYEINTPLRVQHFLAQIATESDGFNTAEEYASGKAYEGREDLGNVNKGDGVKYKGKGLMQLTGRENYRLYGNDIGVNLVNNPDLVKTKYYADVAGWYWSKKNLNKYADQDDIKTVTRKINGGYNGLDSRLKYLAKAKIYIKELAQGIKNNSGALTVVFIAGTLVYLVTKK